MFKTILVTGGAGYIGSVACELLLKKNYNVIVIDDLSTGNKNAIFKESKFYEMNLSQTDELDKIFKENKIDVVMHFAGAAVVSESVQDPKKYFDINYIQGKNLLKTMIQNDVKNIVFSSTCATFGIPTEKMIPISENTPQKPINPYGQSKLLFEKALEWYRNNKNLNFIALRYFNVVGATENRGEHHEPETHLIPLVLDVVKNNKSILRIYGNDFPTKDGTTIRDYVHVVDLINAHILALKALEENKKHSFFYNLGYGGGYSVLEIIKNAESVLNTKINYEVSNRRIGDPPILVANPSKIKTELGWMPEHNSLKEIILSAYKHV